MRVKEFVDDSLGRNSYENDQLSMNNLSKQKKNTEEREFWKK